MAATLKNTRKHGNLVLEPQIEFSSSAVRNLKDFYEQFFDSPPRSNEARALGTEIAKKFDSLSQELRELIARKSEYPFLAQLKTATDRMAKLGTQPYKHFLTDFSSESDDLLDIKEDLLDPIQRFMKGSGAQIFADTRQFLEANKANFQYLSGSDAEQLGSTLADPRCYAGNGMKSVKEMADSLAETLTQALTDARQAAEQTINSKFKKLETISGYANLTENQLGEITTVVTNAIAEIQDQRMIAVVKESASRFENTKYTEILHNVITWTTPPPSKPETNETPDDDNTTDAPQQGETDTNPTPAPKPSPPVEFIRLSTLTVSFDKPWLQTPEEVDAYVELLRQSLTEKVNAGKRIQL